MPVAAWVLVSLLLAGTLALVFLVVRVRSISSRVGSFECALQQDGQAGWASGIASFGTDRLDWYRVVSASPRPEASWSREGLEVLGRSVRLIGGRSTSVVEVRCGVGATAWTLAMSRSATAGLTSWLEAAPPGQRLSLR